MPRSKDSATFSAAWRHTEQERNSASPSFHSLVWRSKVRGVEAIRKLATAAPEGVKRSSGPPTGLPTTVMTVSPAMKAPYALVLIRDVRPRGPIVAVGADRRK